MNVLKELLKDEDTTKDLLMQIDTEERRAANNHRVKHPPYPRIARVIDSFKNACIYPEDPDFDIDKYSRFDAAVFRTVYSPYQELLLIKNRADFGDLIQLAIKLFQLPDPPILKYYQKQFKHVLVDEVQDLNKN